MSQKASASSWNFTDERFVFPKPGLVLICYFFVLVYDALTGEKVQSLAGHTACVRDVSWHPYKPEIASTSVRTLIFSLSLGNCPSSNATWKDISNGCQNILRGVAVISAKNHKRPRRKRQSVTAKREKSQTPKVLTAILTLPNLT